jgi:hypothetical protein
MSLTDVSPLDISSLTQDGSEAMEILGENGTDLIADLDTLYIHIGAINAKGDLLVGTANDVVTNLPVGSNGKLLMANSAEVSGVEWVSTLTAALIFAAAVTHTADITMTKSNPKLKVGGTDGAAAELPVFNAEGGGIWYANNDEFAVGRTNASGVWQEDWGKFAAADDRFVLNKGIVVNEEGNNSDTRIEGDTDANLLFVDASADAIAIGASDPSGSKLDINDDSIRVRTAKTPASAGAAGVQGEIAWDANFVYICTATNTWKRAAIATW